MSESEEYSSAEDEDYVPSGEWRRAGEEGGAVVVVAAKVPVLTGCACRCGVQRGRRERAGAGGGGGQPAAAPQ